VSALSDKIEHLSGRLSPGLGRIPTLIGDTGAHRIHFIICDGIRAVAILLVVLGHLSQPTGPGGHGLPQLGLWGVATFFILSGFLLGRPYLQAILNDASPWPSYKLFLTRRFLRIVPLYEAAVAFSVIMLCLSGITLDWRDIIAHVLFLQDLSASYSSSLNSPLWTMPIDICFYLGMPLLMYGIFTASKNRTRNYKIKLICTVFALAIFVGLGYRAAVAAQHSISQEQMITALRGIIGSGTSFILGLGLALIDILHPAFRPSKLTRISLFLTGIAIDGLYPHFVPSGLLNLTTFDLAAGLASFALILATWKSGIIARIAGSPVVSSIALLSYGIYLFHAPIVAYLISLQPQHNGYRAFAFTSLGTLAILLPLTFVAHASIEKPMLRLKAKSKDAN
jgi:peptidoglycan/LPS O-acetylase OafA/YrhL